MIGKNLIWKYKILLFSFPLLLLIYDFIRIILSKFPLKLFIQSSLYYLLITTILICIFIFARLILVKISKIDILLSWPILFIIFLRLSVHHALPIFKNSVLPIASGFIISVILITLINNEKISFIGYFQYNICVLIFFLLFIQCNLLVFLLIMCIPLILLFAKKILGHGPILILGGTILMLGLIILALPFFYKTANIYPVNKIPDAHGKNNVIFIIIDTARKDCIDLKSKNTITPSLKHLAENGIVIKRFIANGAWTPPAHASLFTGLLPSDHGVLHYDNSQGFTVLSDKLLTLAEILQNNGINTGGFYANLLLKEEFGFEQGFNQYSFVPFDFVPITICTFEKNLERLIKYFPKYFSKYKFLVKHNNNNVALSDKVLKEATKWVNSNGSNQNFFLFINLMDQHFIKYFHDPIERKLHIGPNYYIQRDEKAYLKPEIMIKINKRLLNWHKLTIKNVDYYLGKFFKKLKDQGLYENTTIIVTADHGNLFGEWAHYDHQDSIYAPNVFIPFIIKYSKFFSERIINPERIFQQVDVFAEILNLFNIKNHPYSYGKAFILKEGNPVISQLYRMKDIPISLKHILDKDLCGTYLNINGDYYQLIYSTDGKHEMYRIQDFCYAEINNLYKDFKENHKVLEFISNCPDILERRIYNNKPINNKDILQKLKSLGYLK